MTSSVQQAPHTGIGFASSVSAAFGASVTSGNSVVVAILQRSGTSVTITSVTDDQSNSYGFVDSIINGNGETISWYLATGITNSPDTVTLNLSGSDFGWGIGAEELVGEVAGAVSGPAENDGSGTSATVDVTVDSANSTVVGVAKLSSSQTFAMAGGQAAPGTAAFDHHFSKDVAAPGINSCVGTLGASASWDLVGLSFEDAGGSPADTTAPTYSSNPAESTTGADQTTCVATASDETDSTVDHYAVVVANGATAPNATQIQAGQDSTGSAAIASGSDTGVSNGAEASINLTGLSSVTAYDVYWTVVDSSGNAATPQRIDITTTASGPSAADLMWLLRRRR